MNDAGEETRALIWADLRSVAWQPADVIVQAANAILGISVLLTTARIENAAIYAGMHLLNAVIIALLARADAATAVHHPNGRRRTPVRFLHHWLPVAFLLGVYFELGLLIPQMHPFDDRRYDRALQAIDVWLVGDPVALIARFAWAPLSDVLTACYWSYYAFPVVLPALLYARGSMREFQRVAAIITIGYLLCYAGYFMFPAIGPHVLFDPYRPSALDGYGFARRAYALLRTFRLEPPDAFPSGHTLVGLLVPALAWRYSRSLFFVLAPLGLGIVLATVYLRFHYVADVAAALLLAPLAYKIGDIIDRRFAVRPSAGRCDRETKDTARAVRTR